MSLKSYYAGLSSARTFPFMTEPTFPTNVKKEAKERKDQAQDITRLDGGNRFYEG